MTANRVAKVAWRLGWTVLIAAALLAPKAAEAYWFSWRLWMR